MVAVKAGAVDGFIARPPENVFCFLVYGPDTGLVSERATALSAAAVDDPADPFSLIRLDGDEVASDPSRLLDEAHTVALFGGRRAILLRVGSRQVSTAVERLLGGPRPDARIVIQAGDLKRNAPVRSLCERHAAAAAIACYSDNEAGLARLIDAEIAAAGMTIDRDGRALLLASLGADRLASRQEIAKLVLYAHGRSQITAGDVEAAVADASALVLDDVVDAAFTGNAKALEQSLAALAAAGTTAAQALGAALRHALQLQRIAILASNGTSPSSAVERGWPGLHFRRRAAIERMAAIWKPDQLAATIERLNDAVLASRRAAALSETLAQRSLSIIAQTAGRLARR